MVFDQVEFPAIKSLPKTCQTFNHLEIGDVLAVVVIPHCGGCFVKIWLAIVAHRDGVGIIIIPVITRIDHKGWVTIGVGRGVGAMEVNRFTFHHHIRQARNPGQFVPVPDHHGLTDPGLEGRTGHGAVIAKNISGINPISTIDHHLKTSPFTLRVPGGQLTSIVIRNICSSNILLVKFGCNTVIINLV